MKILSLLRVIVVPMLVSALHAAADDAPIVGAIRWDAWYGEGGATKIFTRAKSRHLVTG